MKIFKIASILLSVLVISGCKPSPRSKALQDYYCKDKGGVYFYAVSSFNKGYCNNNHQYGWRSFNTLTLPEEFYPEKEK